MKLLALNRFEPIDDAYGEPGNNKVIDASTIDDPLRDGAETFSNGVGGISNPDINGFADAQDTLLAGVQNGINRFIGFLALITVIYLIIQGIQLLISPKDDELKKIGTRIQSAARVLGGIGLSWLFVSFVFWIVKQFVGA